MPKKRARVVTSDATIDAAIARGRAHALPRVVEGHYDEATDEIVIRFENGVRMAFPRPLLEGLSEASSSRLKDITIAGPGTGLYWPQLDVGHYVRGLIDGVFGTRRWMQELGRRGGATSTPAKSAAARLNGKKGGRPRKAVALVRWRLPNLDRVALRVVHAGEAAGFRRIPARIRDHLNARAPQIGEQRIQIIHSQIDHELLVGGEMICIGRERHEHRGPRVLLPDSLLVAGNAEMGAVPRCQSLRIARPEEKPANAGYCHGSLPPKVRWSWCCGGLAIGAQSLPTFRRAPTWPQGNRKSNPSGSDREPMIADPIAVATGIGTSIASASMFVAAWEIRRVRKAAASHRSGCQPLHTCSAYLAIFERADDGSVFAYVPDLPGCTSWGRTLDDAFKNIGQTARLWIAAVEQRGGKLPHPCTIGCGSVIMKTEAVTE
jgi:predicted RNase H-like HicB family nuclease